MSCARAPLRRFGLASDLAFIAGLPVFQPPIRFPLLKRLEARRRRARDSVRRARRVQGLRPLTRRPFDTPWAALDAHPLGPFGRFATFTNNAAGQLASITDVMGLTSSFAYGPDDFVNTLTTPYGITSFRHESNAGDMTTLRFVEATDPLGGTEHVEFQWETPSLAATAPASDVPTGFTAWNTNLDHYNTFYWDKRAWMLGPGDLSKATVTHWMVGPEWPGWQRYSYVPHSVKKPLEGRVWYAYPNQVSGNEDTLNGFIQPSRIGRVVDGGASQLFQTTYGVPRI